MAKEQAARKIVRKLIVDLYDDGNWSINIQPSTPEMLKVEALGILTLVLDGLRPPTAIPTVTPQAEVEGSSDVG